MKAISPLVSIVLIIFIVTTLSVMLYTFLSRTQSELMVSFEQHQEATATRAGAELRIVGFDTEKRNITVRNTGRYELNNFSVYLGGQPTEFTGPDKLGIGEVAVFTVPFTIQLSDEIIDQEVSESGELSDRFNLCQARRISQQFISSYEGEITKIAVVLSHGGLVDEDLSFYVYNDTDGYPGSILFSTIIPKEDIPVRDDNEMGEWMNITVDLDVEENKKYWMVFNSSTTYCQYRRVYKLYKVYSSYDGETANYVSGSWSYLTDGKDLNFKEYMRPPSGLSGKSVKITSAYTETISSFP